MSTDKNHSFSSQVSFILAAAGSAIGLANIWKFPYIVGKYGGGAFLIVYLAFLALIGLPVFLSEIAIGTSTRLEPSGAFRALWKSSWGQWTGFVTILTGFLVSSFYSVVAGWIFGYLVAGIQGKLVFQDVAQAQVICHSFLSNPLWGLTYHLLFMVSCGALLYGGVRKGLQKANNIFMPLFFVILFGLVSYSISLAGGVESVVSELFTLRWNELTPAAILIALGHSFFTLSVGQGTMVTYGSYLGGKSKLLTTSIIIVLTDTIVSILAAIMIFSVVLSKGAEMEYGPKLIFETLPVIFNQIPFGGVFAFFFFLLVWLAALTSQLSALEPLIAYLTQNKGVGRKSSVMLVCITSFLIGIPSALSSNLLKDFSLKGMNFFDGINFLTTGILIPLGGLAAILTVGWIARSYTLLDSVCGDADTLSIRMWKWYLNPAVKWTAPFLIIVVLIYAVMGGQ